MTSSLLEHTISASMDNAGCESDSVHVRSEDNGTSQCNERNGVGKLNRCFTI